MEGEFFDQSKSAPRVLKPREKTAWELSIMRVSRAQALLWNECPINERLKILARVDAEQKGEQ